MTRTEAVVAAARAAIGTRFRLHGRDHHGMDCVGLIGAALRAGGMPGALPTGYALRGGTQAAAEATAAALGLARAEHPQAGDVLLLRPAARQLHFAIWTGGGIVHACAMLRRVVERPGPPPWPVLAIWRIEGA